MLSRSGLCDTHCAAAAHTAYQHHSSAPCCEMACFSVTAHAAYQVLMLHVRLFKCQWALHEGSQLGTGAVDLDMLSKEVIESILVPHLLILRKCLVPRLERTRVRLCVWGIRSTSGIGRNLDK